MPSHSAPLNPEYWEKRAEEARTLAGEMHNAQTRLLMLRIAESYEQIVEIAKSCEKVTKLSERPHQP